MINKKIQEILYLKNIKINLTFGKKLLNLVLNSNYSFFDKNLNNESESNIINFKINNNGSEISDLEIFVQSDNNLINIKEFKKYFDFQNQYSLIEDQIINLNSDFRINASIDEEFDIKKICYKIKYKF